MRRVLLLVPSTSYRAGDFMHAARQLGIDVVVGSNHRPVLGRLAGDTTLVLDFDDAQASVGRIAARHGEREFAAVVGTDQETVHLASVACAALGLAHNAPTSVVAAHCKYRFRRALLRARVRSPWFFRVSLDTPLDDTLRAAANEAAYPCVLKPLDLCASRGVIRADDANAFIEAGHRVAAIVRAEGSRARPDWILVEAFMPGREVALEGVLNDGTLSVVALFDKPDPLDGPYFEETLYVTPSRLSRDVQQAIADEVERGADALGLTTGPIHAELRVNANGIWLIEMAARSIGGLCSRALRFVNGASLEELILRQALGLLDHPPAREAAAAGVMMLPIQSAGRLQEVAGVDAARAVAGVEDVVISIARGARLVPLPEGDRYLGFVFARGNTPAVVEQALRLALARLQVRVVAE